MDNVNINSMPNDSKHDFICDCIFLALMRLMQQKSMEKITITELAEVAGTSRMSFYRNYSSLESIITAYLDKTSLGLSNFIGKNYNRVTNKDIHLFVDCIFEFWVDNKVLLTNLCNSNKTRLIFDWMKANLPGLFRGIISDIGPVQAYEINSFIGSLYEILMTWVNRGMIDSELSIAKDTLYGFIYSAATSTKKRLSYSSYLDYSKFGIPSTYNGVGVFSDIESNLSATIYVQVENDEIVYTSAVCSNNQILKSAISLAMTLCYRKSTLTALTLTLDDVSREIGGIPATELCSAAVAAGAMKNAVIDYYNRANLQRAKDGVENFKPEWHWSIDG